MRPNLAKGRSNVGSRKELDPNLLCKLVATQCMASYTILPPTMVINGLIVSISSAGTVR